MTKNIIITDNILEKNIESCSIENIKYQVNGSCIKIYGNELLINKLESRNKTYMLNLEIPANFRGYVMNHIKIYHENPKINDCLNNNSFFDLEIGGSVIYSNKFMARADLLPFILMMKFLSYHEVKINIYVHDETIGNFINDNFELNIQFENIIFNKFIIQDIYEHKIEMNNDDNNILHIIGGLAVNQYSNDMDDILYDIFNFEPFMINKNNINKNGLLATTVKSNIDFGNKQLSVIVDEWTNLKIDACSRLSKFQVIPLTRRYKNAIYSLLHKTIDKVKKLMLMHDIGDCVHKYISNDLIQSNNDFMLITLKYNYRELLQLDGNFSGYYPHNHSFVTNSRALFNIKFNSGLNNNVNYESEISLIIKPYGNNNNNREIKSVIKYGENMSYKCINDVDEIFDKTECYYLYVDIPNELINDVNFNFDLELQVIHYNRGH